MVAKKRCRCQNNFSFDPEGLEMERLSPVDIGGGNAYVVWLGLRAKCPSENKAQRGLKMAVTWKATA